RADGGRGADGAAALVRGDGGGGRGGRSARGEAPLPSRLALRRRERLRLARWIGAAQGGAPRHRLPPAPGAGGGARRTLLVRLRLPEPDPRAGAGDRAHAPDPP